MKILAKWMKLNIHPEFKIIRMKQFSLINKSGNGVMPIL